jgi:hypothetical protein
MPVMSVCDDCEADTGVEVHRYDHAFLIHRSGHDAVLGLKKAFMHCNQPFDKEIKVRSTITSPPRVGSRDLV